MAKAADRGLPVKPRCLHATALRLLTSLHTWTPVVWPTLLAMNSGCRVRPCICCLRFC